MKLPLFSSAVALCAAGASAKLTPHNTTYDLFSVYARSVLPAVGETALGYDSLNVTEAFEKLLTKVEDGLAAETLEGVSGMASLEQFFSDVEAVTSEETAQELRVKAAESTYYLPEMFIAPREWSDVVFDVAESVTKDDKDLRSWVAAQRLSMEESVLNHTVPELLTVRMSKFIAELYSFQDDMDTVFYDAYTAVEEEMAAAYNFDPLAGSEEAEESGSAADAEELEEIEA